MPEAPEPRFRRRAVIGRRRAPPHTAHPLGAGLNFPSREEVSDADPLGLLTADQMVSHHLLSGRCSTRFGVQDLSVSNGTPP